jgi:L-lactate dehydrogenase complex protein LldG
VAVLPAVRAGRGIVSSVPELDVSLLTIGPDASRQQLDEIELAIIPGRLGVAENGAIWVDDADLPHRALPFVAQHLAIVLAKRDIVADMHAAYARLPRPLPGYGVFISGPSKTADIEQALVIGAQGPKSLVVLLT